MEDIITQFIREISKYEEVYIVGGAVRDSLLGRKSIREIDLIVKNIDKVKNLLGKRHFIELSEKFGTLRVFTNDLTYDISPIFEDIETDLKRRDFTVNAIAYDVRTDSFVDPLKGIDDLKHKILRCVSENSIQDDPVRILRAARFGPGSGFSVDTSVQYAVSLYKEHLKRAPPERLGQEILKICICDKVSHSFSWLHNLGVLASLLPPWSKAIGFIQNEFHVEDVAAHTLTVIKRMEDLPDFRSLMDEEKQILILSALFHDLMKPDSFTVDRTGRRRFFNHEYLGARLAAKILSSWALPSEIVAGVELLVRLHMRPIQCGQSGARRILRETGKLFHLWRLIKIADKPPIQPDEDFFKELERFDLLIQNLEPKEGVNFNFNGHTLISLGFKPGPNLGLVLRSLRQKALESPNCNSEKFVQTIASRFRRN